MAHFAHKDKMGHCSGESAEHRRSISNIQHGIAAAHQAGQPYLLEWECGQCGGEHTVDLALPGTAIHVTRPLERVVPDLLITSEENGPRAAIEVVWKHPVDARKFAIYQELELPLLIVRPTAEGIGGLSKGIASPFAQVFFLACPSDRHVPPALREPTCAACGGPLVPFRFETWHGYTCYHCDAPVPVLRAFQRDAAGAWCEITELPQSMETPAATLRVALKQDYGKGQGRSYMMHHCPGCRRKQGDFFVRNLSQARPWKAQPDHAVRVGYFLHCPECNAWRQHAAGKTRLFS